MWCYGSPPLSFIKTTMMQKYQNFFLFLVLLFFLAGCNTTKLFYDYGDIIASWQLDSYFELTNAQEEWVEERMRLHLEWHRNVELPRYKRFLIDIQNRAKDGLTMSELDEGFSRYEAKMGRTFERLIPDAALFLTKISPEQINNLEREIAEENEEMMEKLEHSEERLQKRQEEFWVQMEDWFGEFTKAQQRQIKLLQTKWYTESADPLTERMERRRKSQPQFLALLRSSPDSMQLENWFRQWTQSWQSETNPLRDARIQRNKKRILQFDAILTPLQRQHAVRELDDWIETLDTAIVYH